MSPQGVTSIAMGITKDGVSVERVGVEAPNSRTPTASKETKLVMHRLTSRLSSGNKRPLCSSPLAGPALSNPSVVGLEIDNFIDEELPVVLSSPSTAVSRRKKPAEGTVRFSTLPMQDRPHSSAYVTSPPPRSSSLCKTHRSSWDHSSATLRDLPVLPYMPPPPSRSIEGMPQPFPSTRTLRPSAPPQNPSHPNFTQAPSNIHAGRPSMSPDPSKNWMTTNTYETTPRFSRLGMAASNVVLPTPARDYKRRASGDWRPTSLPFPSAAHLHLPQKQPPHIARKSSLRTLSSASSSRETLPLSSSSSMAPSRRSSSDIGTVVEESEEEDAEREAGKASCASIGIGIGLSGELKVQKGYPLLEITPTDTHIRETPARSPPVSSRCESVAEPMPLLKKVKASWMAEGRINAPGRAQQPACCQDAGAKGNAADARAGSITSCWNRLLRRGSRFGRDSGL